MSLSCGIVGLPNVGKSTLFNALTESSKAESANYPFCTIEPNSGIVPIRDERLEEISKIGNSEKTIFSTMEFVDIAGLVEGASKGAGLGNKFLSHIREVAAIVHVVRCFQDNDILHTNNQVNPLHDIEVIETELMLADLESVTKQISSIKKKARTDKSSQCRLEFLKDIEECLINGTPVRSKFEMNDDLKEINLLTSKPVLYICNTKEKDINNGNEFSKQVYDKYGDKNCITISAELEQQLSVIPDFNERTDFLKDLGINEFGVNKLAKAAYKLLGLESYFTVGPKEAKSWTFKKGALAPQAAGVIHTDFEKGFIKAEVIKLDDFIEYGSLHGAKKHGAVELVGKDYVVQDGDIILFKFNVS